ncbi:TolC family protein [Pelagicoccus sp. SDUM812002]|uniref:TolC family protein n=1 Tax=Pelagicoccus sp. SDUM812002 TaxID=3041266 RepID=UPI00280F101C|nr:TolC family protein [Pelagicoccus sp. SDUM812002]MDQ8186207.1 TolC family protein [Pelagicoccus sp. SDUM812002]
MEQCFLAGCRSGSDFSSGPLAEVPEQFGSVEQGLQTVEREEWFSFFDDPELLELVDRAMENNPGLGSARARMLQAQVRAGLAGSALWPTVEASIEASRRHAPLRMGIGPTAGEQGIQTIDTYRASLAASYEVDLWGRLRDEDAAARIAAEAAREQLFAARMTVAANLTGAWLDVLLSRQRAEVLAEQVDLSRTLLELTEEQLANGQGSALNVARQEQQYLSVLELKEREEARLVEAEVRVSILAGEAPQELDVSLRRVGFPELPPIPDPGVPADLIYRRPDLQAAYGGIASPGAARCSGPSGTLAGASLASEPIWRGFGVGRIVRRLVLAVGGELVRRVV